MAVLSALVAGLASGSIEVVDLTAPLSQRDPDPEAARREFGQTAPFELEEISALRRPRPGLVLEQLPHRRAHRHPLRRAQSTGSPARTARTSRRCRPDDLVAPGGGARLLRAGGGQPRLPRSRSTTSGRGRSEHGPLPDGGWLLVRTGWDARSDSQDDFLNADETGPHTPGLSAGVRAVGGRGVAGHRHGRRDGRHRRRGRARPSTRCSRATRS